MKPGIGKVSTSDGEIKISTVSCIKKRYIRRRKEYSDWELSVGSYSNWENSKTKVNIPLSSYEITLLGEKELKELERKRKEDSEVRAYRG